MRFSMNEIISSFYFVMDLDTDIVENLFCWVFFSNQKVIFCSSSVVVYLILASVFMISM